MSWEDIGFDFDRVGVKAYDDYNSPKLTIKTSAKIESRIMRNLTTTFFGVDLSENEPDYTSLGIIDLRKRTIESRIISTDNPDPNSWVKKFFLNEQEKKEQEPSDEDRREQNLRNAEEDRCV